VYFRDDSDSLKCSLKIDAARIAKSRARSQGESKPTAACCPACCDARLDTRSLTAIYATASCLHAGQYFKDDHPRLPRREACNDTPLAI